MPTTVYEPEILTLDDEVQIVMKPLKIAKLRKFMSEIGKLDGVQDDNEKSFDALTECVIVALQQWSPEMATKAWIEDNLDINNYYDIIRAASGIDMRQVGNV